MFRKKKVIALIPCRYESTRFKGKPLALICGKPMMYHVYKTTISSNYIDDAFIITNNLEIREKCKQLGMNVLFSKKNHETGTDRIAEFAVKIKSDFVINVQGDEPMIKKKSIDTLIKSMLDPKNKKYDAFNGYHIIKDKKDVYNENIVKTIFKEDKELIYFSRQPIPSNSIQQYNRQIGLYGFKKKAILIFNKKKPKKFEKSERVEMLRLLENSCKILMVKINDVSKSVDTPSDLKIVKRLMNNVKK